MHLVFGYFINDGGVIGGVGVPPGVSPYDAGALGHAYVLIPVDEGKDEDKDGTENTRTVTPDSTWNSDHATTITPTRPSKVRSQGMAVRDRMRARLRDRNHLSDE